MGKVKLKNVHPGDIFEIVYPDREKRHGQFFDTSMFKTGEHTIKFTRGDGVVLEMSNNDKVKIIMRAKIDKNIQAATKKALNEDINKKNK